MKEIIINKTIENEVEVIISLASQIAKIRKDFPECWTIIAKQFQLRDYNDSSYISDDMENVKISLYAAIIRQNNFNESKKKEGIKKALQAQKNN